MGNAAGFSRSYRALFAIALLGAAPAAAAECPGVDAIAFDDAPRTFTQSRTLPSLPNPLLSAGVLQAREDSFVWQVCEPFDIRTVIDKGGVTQSIEGAPPTTPGPDALQSAIQKIGIADIFRGRFDRLEAVFDVEAREGAADAPDWRATLTPRSDAIGRVVSQIEISGCDAIRRVRISYSDGGLDDISVDPPRAGLTRAKCGAE